MDGLLQLEINEVFIPGVIKSHCFSIEKKGDYFSKDSMHKIPFQNEKIHLESFRKPTLL